MAGLGFTNLWGVDKDTQQFQCRRARCLEFDLDADDLDLGEIKFDLITAIEVVEHLENPGHLFSSVAYYLSNSGYFLMTTPNIQSLLCRFRFFMSGHLKQFDHKGDLTHIYPVLLTALRRVLLRNQLEIVSQWCYPPDGSSITSRRSLALTVTVLKLFLRDPVPGDMLCLLIRKRAIQPTSTENRVGDDS